MMNEENLRVYTAPIPKMPPGLIDLMEGLAKDVLKCNPTDVYTFCANHMKKLLEIRDGSSSTRAIITLEQKLIMAINKVRERASKRREEYDKQMLQILSQQYENNIVKTDKSHVVQCNKDIMVKIPESDLSDNVEPEMIAKVKEVPLISEFVKHSNVDMASSTTVTTGFQTSLQQESSVKIMDVARRSPLHEIKYTDGNGIFEKNDLTSVAINDNVVQQKIDIIFENSDTNDKFISASKASDERNSTILVDCSEASKNQDNSSNKQNISTFIENEDNTECEKKPKECNENQEYEANMQNNNKNVNNGCVRVINSNATTSLEVLNNFAQKAHTAVNGNDANNPITFVTDNTRQNFATDKKLSNGVINPEPQHFNENNASTLVEEKSLDSEKCSDLLKHVNTSATDLETAAITIQKVFRSFLFRNKTLSTDDATNVDINVNMENKEKKDDSIPSMDVTRDHKALGASRIDSVLQTVNEEKSLSLSTDDSSTLSSAATIIQAHVRGFLVRNKVNVNKNSSTTSGIESDGISFTSVEGDDGRKNKTILNIHIVPESGPVISRDESVLTSIDFSSDGSPPGSTNLHILDYDTTERRKQLKREDAIQSISPPSNNSRKLSEDFDSVKEVMITTENENFISTENSDENPLLVQQHREKHNILENIDHYDTALEVKSLGSIESPEKHLMERPQSLPEMTSDEMDVVIPFTPSEDKMSDHFVNGSNLIHSGEYHEVVLPTKVSRSDTSVVRGE